MPEIKMDYDLVEEMRTEFRGGIEDLGDARQQLLKTIKALHDDEGLLGDGGDAFCNALSKLVTKVDSITQKFEEMIVDLDVAENAFRKANADTVRDMGKP
jgi:uncharacterized protein YukE